MNWNTALVTLVAAVCLSIGGCKSDPNDTMPITKATNTYAVVVGMEKSNFAGACPGAQLDSDRMASLLRRYTPNVVLIQNDKAKKSVVVDALCDAVEKAGDGLTIFYYSGHGGSEAFPYTGLEETDGKDEFFCLYDTYLRDNEVWQIIQKCRGRIYIIADCCHSQTIYRSPMITLTRSMPLSISSRRDSGFSMLCWSGCPDNTYSYGDSSGGQFTNALLRHFASNKTYEVLWKEIKNDKTLRQFEDPQSTAIGEGFVNKYIFR